MALFTDGPPSTIDDLTGQDSQLLDVASNEGIDLGRKLTLAQEELGVELNELLGRLSPAGREAWQGPAVSTANVVVTPALKMWHTFRTLEMAYRDAYFNQLNDRYAGKRDGFRAMAKWAYEKLIQAGVGTASRPLPRAAAPDVQIVSGSLPYGVYYVATAWVNDAGEEGACGPPTVTQLTSGTLQVDPGDAPQYGTRWNVYMGDSSETMKLQNATPIAAGETWTQPSTLNAAGRLPGSGQQPDTMRAVPRAIQRG